MSKCPRCNRENRIVNECRCDPNNLPTRVPEIKLRWLDIGKVNGESLLAESVHGLDLRAEKVSALSKLNISVAADQKPLHAWLLAMCRENGLPEVLPAREIGNAICAMLNPGARQFMFWLA